MPFSSKARSLKKRPRKLSFSIVASSLFFSPPVKRARVANFGDSHFVFFLWIGPLCPQRSAFFVFSLLPSPLSLRLYVSIRSPSTPQVSYCFPVPSTPPAFMGGSRRRLPRHVEGPSFQFFQFQGEPRIARSVVPCLPPLSSTAPVRGCMQLKPPLIEHFRPCIMAPQVQFPFAGLDPLDTWTGLAFFIHKRFYFVSVPICAAFLPCPCRPSYLGPILFFIRFLLASIIGSEAFPSGTSLLCEFLSFLHIPPAPSSQGPLLSHRFSSFRLATLVFLYFPTLLR